MSFKLPFGEFAPAPTTLVQEPERRLHCSPEGWRNEGYANGSPQKNTSMPPSPDSLETCCASSLFLRLLPHPSCLVSTVLIQDPWRETCQASQSLVFRTPPPFSCLLPASFFSVPRAAWCLRAFSLPLLLASPTAKTKLVHLLPLASPQHFHTAPCQGVSTTPFITSSASSSCCLSILRRTGPSWAHLSLFNSPQTDQRKATATFLP